MLVTQTPASSPTPRVTWARARRGPRRQACPASCSSWSGAGVIRRWGMRARARTAPFSSAATALTAVVPMSIPTVTEPDTTVMIGHYE